MAISRILKIIIAAIRMFYRVHWKVFQKKSCRKLSILLVNCEFCIPGINLKNVLISKGKNLCSERG